MERKFITNELIKVANALDEMGFIKEANNLDRIAKKVVAKRDYIPQGYAKDIITYKNLIGYFQNEKDPNYKKEYAQQATWFLNDVMADSKLYSQAQKDVFKYQAAAIRNVIYGNLDGDELNEKLHQAMKDTFAEYKDGQVSYNSNDDVLFFTEKWMKEIQPEFDLTVPNIAKWLSNKFLIFKKQILTNKAKLDADTEAKKPKWWQI